MEDKQVKPDHTPTNRAGTAGQGLRILARMIARCLVTQELGVNEQFPYDSNEPYVPGILGGETKKDAAGQQSRSGKNLPQPLPSTPINYA